MGYVSTVEQNFKMLKVSEASCHRMIKNGSSQFGPLIRVTPSGFSTANDFDWSLPTPFPWNVGRWHIQQRYNCDVFNDTLFSTTTGVLYAPSLRLAPSCNAT